MGIMSGKYQPGAACQMRLIHVPSVSVSASKSRGSGSLLVVSLQVCMNTTPKRKNVSNDLKEEKRERRVRLYRSQLE